MNQTMLGHSRIDRKPRPGSLGDLHREASGRMKEALESKQPSAAPMSEEDLLLLRAERAVRHKIRWRKTIPLNLLTMLPGLLFIGTRSKVVLALLVFTYPLALVARAILARILSSLISSEETLLRIEYANLIHQSKQGSEDGATSHRP